MKTLIIILLALVPTWNNTSSQAYTDEGIKLFEQRNYIDALINFNKAIELDSSNYKAFHMRGSIKRIYEDQHGAMQDFNRAIDLNPDLFEAYFERGNIKFVLQDYYGAIADYSQTIRLNEYHVKAYYKRGQAKQQLEAYTDAINDCTKILEINSNNVDAYYLRGILRIEHGQLEQGCLDLSKAGELGDIKAYQEIKDKCNVRFD